MGGWPCIYIYVYLLCCSFKTWWLIEGGEPYQRCIHVRCILTCFSVSLRCSYVVFFHHIWLTCMRVLNCDTWEMTTRWKKCTLTVPRSPEKNPFLNLLVTLGLLYSFVCVFHHNSLKITWSNNCCFSRWLHQSQPESLAAPPQLLQERHQSPHTPPSGLWANQDLRAKLSGFLGCLRIRDHSETPKESIYTPYK